jgi:hypothetical protein
MTATGLAPYARELADRAAALLAGADPAMVSEADILLALEAAHAERQEFYDRFAEFVIIGGPRAMAATRTVLAPVYARYRAEASS